MKKCSFSPQKYYSFFLLIELIHRVMSNPVLVSLIRGTMFYPRIPFSLPEANRLLGRLRDFFPVVYGSPQMDGSVVYSPGDWELRTIDGNIRLMFSAQKIDYIEFGQKDYSREIIEEFTRKCSNIFIEIAEAHGQPSSRLAIAPSFLRQISFTEAKGILDSVYTESKMTFGGAQLDNCEFSQVFRPMKTIVDVDIAVNYLSKFSTENVIPVSDGVAKQEKVIKVDFDINTMPISGISFPIESIRDFYVKAPSFCEEFYQFYFSD